jgi:hypothetical protein
MKVPPVQIAMAHKSREVSLLSEINGIQFIEGVK